MCKTVYALPQRPTQFTAFGTSTENATECNEYYQGGKKGAKREQKQ
jgi:hypothetical protein